MQPVTSVNPLIACEHLGRHRLCAECRKERKWYKKFKYRKKFNFKKELEKYEHNDEDFENS